MPHGFLAFLSFLGAFLCPAPLQEAFLLSGLICWTFFLWRRVPEAGGRGLLVGLGFLALWTLLALFLYLNALDIGCEGGILHGEFGRSYYFDANAYFEEAVSLARILSGPDRSVWFSGEYPWFGFYGPYNAYNILNALLILGVGPRVLSLILAKMVFPVTSLFLLYRLSTRFLDGRSAMIPPLLYGLNPAHLWVTSSLLRDDIVAFFCILVGLSALRCADPGSWREKAFRGLLLAVSLLALFVFRDYAAALFGAGVAFFLNFGNRFRPGRVAFTLLLGILCVIAILSLYTYEWLVVNLLDYEGGWIWNVERTQGIRLPGFTLYYLLFGSTKWVEHFDLRALPEVLGFFGYLYLNVFLTLSAMGYLGILFRKGMERGRKMFLIIFGWVVPFFLMLLITYIFSSPVHRHYGMWIWVHAIVLVLYGRELSWNGKAMALSGSLCAVSMVYWIKYALTGGKG